MINIVQLLKNLDLEKPTGDAEAEITGQNTIMDVKLYVMDKNEAAEDFVKRLPPSQILCPQRADFIAVNSNRNIDGLESFLEKGKKLMKSYEEKYVNEENEEKRALLGAELKEKIGLLAIQEKFLEGRFSLHSSTDVVDEVWLKIVRSTMSGDLGINAKIERKISQYVIRVYTKNFTDEADIRRIGKNLKDLKLSAGRVEYKCTAFSKLGIRLGNIYNMAPNFNHYKDFTKSSDGEIGLLHGVKEENESAETFVARLLPTKVLDSNSIYLSIFKEGDDMIDQLGRWIGENVGNMLLDDYKCQIENAPGPKRDSITKELQEKLTSLAVNINFARGRWIVYATDNVDSLWLKTVQATMNGALGINATIKKSNNSYEVSVITKDFNDEADVKRVLAEMRKLGFKPPLFYKIYLYSKLGISKNNVYGLNPNLYLDSDE